MNKKITGWRLKLQEIIFEADTPMGKVFDVALFWAISLSVITVMLESISVVEVKYGDLMRVLEWVFTLLFSLEYILRIISTGRPFKYVFSFFGLVDLLAILPTYISLFVAGTQYLLIIRALRLLRMFRVLKLARYLEAAKVLTAALKSSRPKIIVFLVVVFSVVLIMGSLMYLIEGGEHGFTSIPRSIYWAIVTVTTVGYGDITPQTIPGQTLSAILMIMGYAIIALPTGFVTAEILRSSRLEISTQCCPACSREGHDIDAVYCKYCGGKM